MPIDIEALREALKQLLEYEPKPDPPMVKDIEERCPTCGGSRYVPGGTACGRWHYGVYC